jgi:hypothetical protein
MDGLTTVTGIYRHYASFALILDLHLLVPLRTALHVKIFIILLLLPLQPLRLVAHALLDCTCSGSTAGSDRRLLVLEAVELVIQLGNLVGIARRRLLVGVLRCTQAVGLFLDRGGNFGRAGMQCLFLILEKDLGKLWG